MDISSIWSIVYYKFINHLKSNTDWYDIGVNHEEYTIELEGTKLSLLPAEIRCTFGTRAIVSIPYNTAIKDELTTAEKNGEKAFQVLIGMVNSKLTIADMLF